MLRSEIQVSLFEHYEPGRDAVLEGAFPQHVRPFPEITNSDATWLYFTVVFVLTEPLLTAGQMVNTIEVGYRVSWDEEHTLGARIQEWFLLSCVAACERRGASITEDHVDLAARFPN